MAPPRERIIRPQSSQGAGGIVAPFQFVTTGEDNLRFRSWSTNDETLEPAIAEFSVRTVSAAGEIQITTDRHVVTQPTIFAETVVPLAPGAVTNVATRYTPQGYPTGVTYHTVELIRGVPPGAIHLVGQLLGGYIAVGKALAWPGSPIEEWTKGIGFQRRYQVGFNTPGAECGRDIQLPFAFRPMSFRGTFVASGAVATRFPALSFFRTAAPTERAARLPLLTTFVAGASGELNWVDGYGDAMIGVPPRYYGPMPRGLLLTPGMSIQTETVGIQAADAWADGEIWGEEYVIPQTQ